MDDNLKAKIWVACDKHLDHDSEDHANGVPVEERLSSALALLKQICEWTDPDA